VRNLEIREWQGCDLLFGITAGAQSGDGAGDSEILGACQASLFPFAGRDGADRETQQGSCGTSKSWVPIERGSYLHTLITHD